MDALSRSIVSVNARRIKAFRDSPMAYKIIRRLNDELVAAGYIIVSGRISRSYFEKKIYGGIA